MTNISREYFSMTDFAVSRMVDFIAEIEACDRLAAAAGEMYPGLVKEGKLRYLLYFDLLKCYRHLGYEPDLSRKESLAFFMAVYSGSGILGDKDGTFENLDAMVNVAGETFNKVVEMIDPQLDNLPDDYGFLVTNILGKEQEDQDRRKRYFILLYRLCSVIAKADGTITPAESIWLSKILKAGSDNPEPVPAKTADAGEASIRTSSAISELDSLVGLENVKKEIHTLANFAMVQKRREGMGLKSTPVSMHLIFSGNPGTGKTTVARIMGRIYKDLGLLKKGHLIEADRSSLVAEYIGQTAVKTNKIIDEAIGGVLFIDEAYSLISDSKQDYGAEAISTLLKRMEDSRSNLAVILAGYTDKMEEFIKSNPGLQSRFSRKIEFEDYSAEDLYKIFKLQLEKYDYTISAEAAEKTQEIMRKTVENKPENFGNGRFARNLFEKVIECQANRVAYLPDADNRTLCTIELSDIESL